MACLTQDGTIRGAHTRVHQTPRLGEAVVVRARGRDPSHGQLEHLIFSKETKGKVHVVHLV